MTAVKKPKYIFAYTGQFLLEVLIISLCKTSLVQGQQCIYSLAAYEMVSKNFPLLPSQNFKTASDKKKKQKQKQLLI